ncbi:hypothetical protein SynWH8103_00472 [Synechococcus sp. WH 8103]|nr:hypothetical protein SynWH8103_00472 [Synechococcus sp. WH 8103]
MSHPGAAKLSALLDVVEYGEDVEITRRGVSVALLTRPVERIAAGFDLDAFLAATTSQPMHQCRAVLGLREKARY